MTEKHFIIYNKNKKCYLVRKNEKNEKYILQNNKKVLLTTIKDKFRYIKQNKSDFFNNMSVTMNSDGDFEFIKIKKVVNYMKVPIFRKLFYHGSAHESTIVKLIKNNLNNKLVRVFNVNKNYYDTELLDIDYKDKSKLIMDIKESLQLLHKLNIIYIDLKQDNIGYSHIDKRWKIFDFDCSGIANHNFQSWNKEPPFLYAYKTAYNDFFNLKAKNIFSIEKKNEILPLNKIDDIMYQNWLIENKLKI